MNAFNYAYDNIVLYVPAGCVKAYELWGGLKDIREIGSTSGINDTTSDNSFGENPVEIYTLDGIRLNTTLEDLSTMGTYIVKSAGKVKKIVIR